MKLTEAKLKQMILDEMRSNLSLADQDQLQADIELVRELSAAVDSLRKERYQLDTHHTGGRSVGRNRSLELIEVDQEIAELERQIRGIATKYGVEFYFGEPGNKYLINLLKRKFRRKSL